MIQLHRAFFHTRQMRIITVIVMIGYLLLLYVISAYQESEAYLLYAQEQITYEYRLQAFLPLKLCLVLLISFGWMYATRWNQYDPLLWVRSSVMTVTVSRFVVIFEWSTLMALVGTFLYLAVYRLYPYDIAIEEVTTLLPAMLLFSLYYNALCFLLERLISHLFGLIIPVLLYLIVMLQSEVILDTTHRFTPMDIIQIVIPDIMIMELGYGFLFGATMVFSIALLWLVIGLLFVRKQDAI